MDELKTTLKSILITSNTQLQAYQLNEDYKALVGKNIPYEQYGYNNLVDFLKSISDVLSVNGSNLFAPVTPSRKAKKRKRKRKKKRNQINLRTPEDEAYDSYLSSSRSNPWTARKGLNEEYSNPAINLKMHIDYAKQTMQFATNFKLNGVEIQEEHKNGYTTNVVEKKPLRYPKTSINIEKREEKIGLRQCQSIPGASRTSMVLQRISVLKQGPKSQPQESRGPVDGRNTSRRRLDPPSLNKPTTTFENLCTNSKIQATIHPQIPKTSTSIMDLPIPSCLPEVPQEFTKTKCGDLIDFDSEVKWPETMQVPSKRVQTSPLFVEVMRLIENLKTSEE